MVSWPDKKYPIKNVTFCSEMFFNLPMPLVFSNANSFLSPYLSYIKPATSEKVEYSSTLNEDPIS